MSDLDAQIRGALERVTGSVDGADGPAFEQLMRRRHRRRMRRTALGIVGGLLIVGGAVGGLSFADRGDGGVTVAVGEIEPVETTLDPVTVTSTELTVFGGETTRVVMDFDGALPGGDARFVEDITSVEAPDQILYTTQPANGTHVCEATHSFGSSALGTVDLLLPAAWFADGDEASTSEPIGEAPKFVVCGPYRGFYQYSIWGPASANAADVNVTIDADRRRLTVLIAATGNAHRSSAAEATPLPETEPAEIRLVEPGLMAVTMPDDAAAFGETLVWTDHELIFWGGQDATSQNVPAGEPGLAYDPQTRIWRRLAASPKPAAYGAAGVWTGSRLIICCGENSPTTVAYDPSLDRWETLPDAPLTGSFAEAVWTGREMIVIANDRAASFDPATATWTMMPVPPSPLGRLNEVVWTGEEVVAWPADVARKVSRGLALDPDSQTWRVLPEPPAWPAVPSLVWTGNDLIVWGGLPAASDGSERAVGSRLDLRTGTWAELPEALPEPHGCECNLGSQTLVWTGERVLVSTGHFSSGAEAGEPLLLSYEPSTDQWSTLGPSPATSWGAVGLMAGDRVVLRSDRLYISEPGWDPPQTPRASS